MTYFVFAFLLVVLKFVLKLSTARTMTKVDVFKALLSFPLDLAFLGLSFGVAYIGRIPNVAPTTSIHAILAIFLAYIVYACVVAAVCRRSDVLFNRDENGSPLVWTGVNYFFAIIVLVFSIYIQQ